MNEINWSLIAPLIVIQMLLMVIALVDCIRSEQTNGPKWLWIVLIVCISLFGPVGYFVFGRRKM